MSGGGGGGSQAPQQQNVTTTTSNLPDYVRPQFEDLLRRAEGVSNTPYTPYSGQRIAGFSPAQQEIQSNILSMGTPQQVPVGSALATQAGLGALQQQNYNPSQITMDRVYSGSRYAPDLRTYQMGAPGSFTTPGTSSQYMSPYMQGVLDVQRRQAIGAARQTQLASDLGAARQGTYGGSRQLLASLGRERALGQQLNDIEATGMQSAFQNAQQQFNAEQAARQAQQQANLQAALGVQGLGAQIGMQNAQQSIQADLANQQQALEAQRLAEQSRQFGAQQGLAGLQLAGQMGQTLGNLGQYQQQMDLSRLQAQQATAAQPQALQQQYMDQQYADFLRQRDYPLEQLNVYNSILRGLPIGLNTTNTTYAQPPSLMSQIAGAGLGAASLSKLLS